MTTFCVAFYDSYLSTGVGIEENWSSRQYYFLNPGERLLQSTSPAGRQKVSAAPYRTVQCTLSLVFLIFIQDVYRVGHPAEV
jgi:hypothetical protein